MSRELVAAALEGAVGVLAEQGWRQGPRPTVRDIRLDPVDMGGAILIAATDLAVGDTSGVYTEAAYALAEWINENPDAGPVAWRDPSSVVTGVDAWNDRPGRTLAEVVHALYGAARFVYPARERNAA